MLEQLRNDGERGVCAARPDRGAEREEFLLNSGGGVDTWTIAGGSFHWPAYECPGLPDPATAGTGDASVIFGDLKSARGWSTAEDDDSAARSAVHRPGSGRVLPRYRVGGDP